MTGTATHHAPPTIEAYQVTKRFGSFTALEGVSLKVEPGEFHALLGENGAGKSTLVKCIIGYQPVDDGSIMIDGKERALTSPRDAHALGVGMVYQHFTLVPSMTVAENLVMSRADVPAVIDWAEEREQLERFLATMPFRVPLDQPASTLSAGERQKTEILKQLYLRSRFLILDEPTSVLTPGEADEMFALLRGMTEAGQLSILLITHKFREVMQFADRVTVLRQGKLAGSGAVKELTRDDLAAMMVGNRGLAQSAARTIQATNGDPMLSIRELVAGDDTGLRSIEIASLEVHPGEIVGVAGVSGNGQRELVEVLAGQRNAESGRIEVHGQSYGAGRREAQALHVRCLPEEPLRNACAPRMSVAENLAFRRFDLNGDGNTRRWLNLSAIATNAVDLIGRYGIKAASPDVDVATLSGGNVQRTVLARELSEPVNLLIVANPCFGLDFSAVAEIRAQIMAARNAGTAVLLVSEDLDELLELSDRIIVMSEGRIVHETPIAEADVPTIGSHMAGHH
jgi:simple sugar transport system ATP-binding protein